MKLPNALTPYLLWIKIGLVLILCGLSAWAAYEWKDNRSQVEITKLQSDVRQRDDQIRMLNATLLEVNSQTEANKKAAAEAKRKAEQAVRDADKAKRLLDQKQEQWEEEFDRIRNNPDCKELLERQLCPLIRDY